MRALKKGVFLCAPDGPSPDGAMFAAGEREREREREGGRERSGEGERDGDAEGAAGESGAAGAEGGTKAFESSISAGDRIVLRESDANADGDWPASGESDFE